MNQDIFFVEEETINNKTIYIIQGLGDNISYGHTMQLCKGKMHSSVGMIMGIVLL